MQNESQVVAIDLTGYDKLSSAQKDEFQDAYDKHQQAIVNNILALAKELDVSEKCASDVIYLRSRFRHTPELEAELIRLHKEGIPVNVYEFGVTEETQKAMMDEVKTQLKQKGINIDD